MKFTDRDFAFFLFCLCVIAAMLSPNAAKGQTTLPMGELRTYAISITESITDSVYVYFDPELRKITKDTVTVPVLCEKALIAGGITVRNGSPYLQDVGFLGVEILGKQMERTFEMRWVDASALPIYQNGGWVGNSVAAREYKSVQIASRYLDPVDGCYVLQPIKNSDK
mgnify:FL=1